MPKSRKEFDYYEYVKIQSNELWRFYIDVCRQNTAQGKAQGRYLFDNEKGYMDGMMRAHRYLNKGWDKDLNAEFILNLHAHAVANVLSADHSMPHLLIDDAYILKFKDSVVGGFSLSSKNTSVNGLIEWFERIISGTIPYATPHKNYTLAKKGPDGLPEAICLVYTDMVYEGLKNFKLNTPSESITKLSLEINTLPVALAEVELELINEERKMGALQEKADEAEKQYQFKDCSIEMRNKLRDEYRHLSEQISWKYYHTLREKRAEISCELRDKTVLLNRLTTLEQLKELKREGKLTEFATQLMAKIDDCFFMPPLYTNEENRLIVEELIKKYAASKLAANDDETKLDTIIKFIQSLEQLHPFRDGNCRVFVMLLLNRELIKDGFPPTMLDNPNQFDLFSKNELKDEIKKGWEYAKQYHSQIAKLLTFKELFNLVFNPDYPLSSTRMTTLFKIADLNEQKQKLQNLLLNVTLQQKSIKSAFSLQPIDFITLDS